MTAVDRDALRKAALACNAESADLNRPQDRPILFGDASRAYIIASKPEVVLALLDELDAGEARHDRRAEAAGARLAAVAEALAKCERITDGFQHHEECDAGSCDENDCACGWENTDADDDERAKVHDAVCSCGIHAFRKSLAAVKSALTDGGAS